MNLQQDKDKILEELYSFHRFGIKPGLKRTQLLLDAIDNPQQKLKSIHVAGTNGKGSVCSMIASLLTTAGYKVGLYTSPHLLEFNERIRINGVNISDDDMLPLLQQLMPIARQNECTFFEITTALAFEYFKNNDVDFAVIETGMGGRYDSTNVLYPKLTIITQIDLDHQEYLGDNIETIAIEKAGIIKPAVPILIADNHAELKELFTKQADKCFAPIFFCDEWFTVSSIKINDNMNMIIDISDGNDEYLNLEVEKSGKHQINNLKAVISAYNFLRKEYDIDENTLRYALKNIKKHTNLFGRIELLQKGPLMILDVAHNPAGAEMLSQTLDISPYANIKFNIVFGVMADKDINNILLSLKKHCNKLIITKPNIDRASDLQNIASIAENLNYQNIKQIDTIDEAMKFAIELSEPTLIVGSFYTASEALNYMKYNIYKQ